MIGSLYATIVIDDYIKPEQFGTKGDGVADDSAWFAKLTNFLSITNCVNVSFDGCSIINKYIQDYGSNDNNIKDEKVIDNVTSKNGFNDIISDKKPYKCAFVVSGFYSTNRVSRIKIKNNTVVNGCGRICEDIIISNNNLINIECNPNDFTSQSGKKNYI